MSIVFTAVEGGIMAEWLKSAPVNATLHMSGLPTSLSSGMTSMAFWKSFAACTCDEVQNWIPLLYTSQQLLGATRRIQAHAGPSIRSVTRQRHCVRQVHASKAGADTDRACHRSTRQRYIGEAHGNTNICILADGAPA